MTLTGTRTFVGFGFGAIQAGLFLYEAYHSGAFRRLHVAEVMPSAVSAVRSGAGYYHLNVAHFDRIEHARIGPIGIEDPNQESDRSRLVQAVSEADEIATAVPSVDKYVSTGDGSLHRILAEGLRRKVSTDGPRAVIYAAENHNQAAEILKSRVFTEIPERERNAVDHRVQFLNSVIGKMSGVVTDPVQIRQQDLQPIGAYDRRAFLVESFNRILISKIRFAETSEETTFQRGISVFEEKDDLLPFEEAKLYGHNATHALAAYLGSLKGVRTIAELEELPGVLEFLRAAFLDESGQALIRKNGGIDPLFTKKGYEEYADDLLKRMLNPYLGDTVERVGRDPLRKLGWDDRLVGTVRVALQQGVEPKRYATGIAAALATLDPSFLSADSIGIHRLEKVWGDVSSDKSEATRVIALVLDGARLLRLWLRSGSAELEQLLGQSDP